MFAVASAGQKLRRFVSLFESETRSDQGHAVLRFHRMMAGVQNARELQEKAAILDDYLRTEKDAHYRSAGEHWRRELM